MLTHPEALERRRKALPIEARIEFQRRVSVSNSIIHDAHMLSLREAKTCAPLLAAENKWEPIGLVSLIPFFIAQLFAWWLGSTALGVLFVVLMSVSFYLCMARKNWLSECRIRLFRTEWDTIDSRWLEVGVKPFGFDPRSRIGIGQEISIYIIEVRKLNGWHVEDNPDATTEINLAKLSLEIHAKLLEGIEREVT